MIEEVAIESWDGGGIFLAGWGWMGVLCLFGAVRKKGGLGNY